MSKPGELTTMQKRWQDPAYREWFGNWRKGYDQKEEIKERHRVQARHYRARKKAAMAAVAEAAKAKLGPLQGASASDQ